MTKATFSEWQEPVTIFALTATMIQYQICVHEEIIEPEEEGEAVAYMYDFHEFTESTEYLQPEAVVVDPEAYLDYVPEGGEVHAAEPAQTTIREEIEALKERQEITEGAILELAELLGGE